MRHRRGSSPGKLSPKQPSEAGAPTRTMLSLKLPRLLSINQVPKVREGVFLPCA